MAPYAGEAAYEKTRSQNLLSSLAGRTPLFALFPSTSYWASLITSLRDGSRRSRAFPAFPAFSPWADAVRG